ncbi:MAG: O-GlcNAc transferase [Verrucomicrobiia bacterium]
MPLNQRARRAIPSVLIVLAIFLAYLPALRGGFIWDDNSWTTKLSGLFRNASGLGSIWCDPTALQQYYPLSGTTFWLDYQFWKFWTPPYHVENVLLHALAALLFWRLLLRLQLPGAWLAAAFFALHPVMVESVAWITERKNVLSLSLYLGALLAYGRYAPWKTNCGKQMTGTKKSASVPDPSCGTCPPSLFFYGLAFFLFLGALLAKTTAFSLPAAILLLGWWQHGRLGWRADILPTLPFFALAIGLCAVTAWLEKNHVGAQGPEFAQTFPQRCLIAGHAFWFYLGKLFWPVNLCFVYPRWQPNPGVWWQWLFPVSAVGTLWTLWLARGRIGRGPATALFFFVGTLFPLLGFLNAYGMRYSFVWDHWVYLSSLGLMALVAALVTRAAEWLRRPAAIYGFAVIVLPVLALLTWRQCGMYSDMETLWQTTLARNPGCWMAHNNLGAGIYLNDRGRIGEAMGHIYRAIQIDPKVADPYFNLGVMLDQTGRTGEAVVQYRHALALNPQMSATLNNLAWILATSSDDALRNGVEAVRLAERADELTLQRNPLIIGTLAAAYAEAGRFPEAVATAEKAEQLANHAGMTNVAAKNRQLLEFYRASKPYHAPPSATSVAKPSPSHTDQ